MRRHYAHRNKIGLRGNPDGRRKYDESRRGRGSARRDRPALPVAGLARPKTAAPAGTRQIVKGIRERPRRTDRHAAFLRGGRARAFGDERPGNMDRVPDPAGRKCPGAGRGASVETRQRPVKRTCGSCRIASPTQIQSPITGRNHRPEPRRETRPTTHPGYICCR